MKRNSSFFRGMAAAAAALLLTLSSVTPASAYTPELAVQSDAYVVIDAASGQVLIEKNMSKRKAPASITKIMTLALALQRCNMDDTITVSKEDADIAPGGTHIALVPGEVITLRDAVMGTQLISANDAANAVASYSGGTIPNFVMNMNLKLEELGLTDSHFVNPNGLDVSGHYVTAYDMAQITRYALSVPGFREIFGATEYQMPPTNIKARNWVFYAQNSIMFPANREYYPGIEGGKLGYTHNANHTLVAAAKRGKMELIVVALDSLGNAAQYSDAKVLLDYCFERYETMVINGRELKTAKIPIANVENPKGMVSVSSKLDYTFVVPLGTPKSSLEIRYNFPEFYKNERRVDPSFSVYTPDGQQVYTSQLSYELLPAEQLTAAAPTARLPKAAFFKDLMMVAFKCLLVVLGVFALVFVAMRCFIMTRYALEQRAIKRRKREALRRKQEALRRRQEDVARSRVELEQMELVAKLMEERKHPGSTGNRIPDNVTHIYPNRNHSATRASALHRKDLRK